MAADQSISLSWPEPNVALLTLDTPGKRANVLSRSVLEELGRLLDNLESRSDLAGLILISGKPDQFVAGADLRELAGSLEIDSTEIAAKCRQGQTLFSRLAACSYLTVAAVEGVCVGGGAELAAWCDRRIVSDHPRTEFGFPEVKLGLLPGWGGTARAPRMIGLGNAVEMITRGDSLSAHECYAMGWASDVVPSQQLLTRALQLVHDERGTGEYLPDRERWRGPLDIDQAELEFLGATAAAVIRQKTKGQYPAPLVALEVMLGGARVDIDAACQLEAEAMSRLFGSPTNAALLNVFFLTDRNKRDKGVASRTVQPAAVKSVGVVGAGIMGSGIAAAGVKRELHTTVYDSDQQALARGVRGVLQEVAYDKAQRTRDLERALRFAPLVGSTLSLSDMALCELVIEAVVENLEIKQQVYRQLEPLLRDGTVLASNTSTIPIRQLAVGLQRPDRFCGIHFFNPVRKMKLVEIIRGPDTSDQTVATAVAYAKRIGKSPIVVNDGPGFLVNRLLMHYMEEALVLLSEGVAMRDIERSAVRFGMPLGPFSLYDMVGIDTAVFAGKVFREAFSDRFVGSPILARLVAAGRLGCKSGVGFYSYRNHRQQAEPDPDLERCLQPLIEPSTGDVTRDEITHRLFLPVVNEATHILQEEIVRNARDIDLGLVFGLGFPPFKGGLMFWVDRLGAARVVEMMRPYQPLGKRFQPSKLLTDVASSGGSFYGTI